MTGSLPERLRAGEVMHMTASVTHARRGKVRNAFRYAVDYLVLAPDHARGRGLFSRNRFNLFSLFDRDHGGERGKGRGAPWAWEQLAKAGFARQPEHVLGLLTQPRFLGYWFNPVSFWLLWRGEELEAVIAEVNNTFGQRHSYLCADPEHSPIAPRQELTADKLFHVSPFQDLKGHYLFRFDIGVEKTAILIRQIDGAEGLTATMHGAFKPLSSGRLIVAALRRPGGALRVVALILWQAIKLRRKGAVWRSLPPEPTVEIS